MNYGNREMVGPTQVVTHTQRDANIYNRILSLTHSVTLFDLHTHTHTQASKALTWYTKID